MQVTRSNGYGSLAQLGEHLPYKQRVSGSSPLTSTSIKAPAKVGAFSFVYPLLISFLTAEFVICQPAEGQRPEQLISHPKAPVNAGAFSFTSEETVIHSRY